MFGTLFKENKEVCKGVRISLDTTNNQSRWKGFIYLPAGVEIDTSRYELKLEDGASGDIIIMSVRGGIAMFRGADEWL